jgi:SAM-dependent methyltransferase
LFEPPAPRITAACAAYPDRPCELSPGGEFFDRSGLLGAVSVHRCARCGVGVSRPPLPDVSFLYADRSSADFQQKTGGLARLIKAVAFRRQARQLLSEVPGSTRGVIDYGCGSGLFTRCLKEALGPEARVTGVDFHPEPPADLGEVPYRAFSQTADLRGTADLLLLMHVLEHDDDPHALLAGVLPLLAPGGHVLIEVPNIDCVWARVFGRFWDAWYLPYHRVHFSRRSLRAVVEASGLVVVRAADAAVPVTGRTLANLAGRSNSLVFILLGAALHPIQWGVERALRRPSALRLVARKAARP